MKRFILGMPSFSLSHSLTLTLTLTLSRPLVNSTEVPYSTRSMEVTRSTETDSAPRSPEIGSAAAKRKRQPRNSACQACAALKVCRHTLLATLLSGTLWHPLAQEVRWWAALGVRSQAVLVTSHRRGPAAFTCARRRLIRGR